MRLLNATGQWVWYDLSQYIPMSDIRLHPDLPWNREGLSMNKDITVEAVNYLDQVMTSATGKWEWRILSSKVPMEDVRAHPDLPWDRYGLSNNKDITVEAMNYLDDVMTNAVGEWNWYNLSRYIPMSDIRAHPDLPWNREGLSWNKDITVEAMNHLDEVMTNAVGEWDWYELSMNVPMSDIRAHPDLPWDMEGLSWNKDITVEAMNYLDDVMTSATGEWDWLSLSSMVPMEDIRAHPDLPWNKYGLGGNKDITLALMDELNQVLINAVGVWDWYELSTRVPMDEIRLRPDLPWDKRVLITKPGVTVDDVIHMDIEDRIEQAVSMEEIKANPLWLWSKRLMSENPRITIEMVLANSD